MYSILIIEDDPAYISMMETILQMEGFDVRTASNGQSGLALIREKRPDLILCDIMMPDMDGHAVLEVLKGDKALADIPFVFVTALGERAEVRRGMSEGADDYLPKPFSADELLAAVTGRIRRHELIIQQHDKSAFQKEQAIFLTRKITRRELDVLLMVGKGSTSREIAEEMEVSVKTIEVHRYNLMNKLGASNAAILARWAVVAELMEHDVEE
jgi:DNA-binding NarL/FixJ family response regulator